MSETEPVHPRTMRSRPSPRLTSASTIDQRWTTSGPVRRPWVRPAARARPDRTRPRPCSTCSMPPSRGTPTGRRSGCGTTTARRPPGPTPSSTVAAGSPPGACARSFGLQPGDRILTWSPSEPALPAAYFGAMRAGLVLVPLDLRMSPAAIQGIVARATPRVLDPRDRAGRPRSRARPASATSGRSTVPELVSEPDAQFPADWERRLDAWPRPEPEDVWDLIFTSGTTGTPKGVMIAHDNLLATMGAINSVLPPLEHRVISVLPLSHLFEQAIGLIYALSVGADILYVRSRNPRVLFAALQAHRVTSMIVVPQVLDLFWSAIEREAERSGRRAPVRAPPDDRAAPPLPRPAPPLPERPSPPRRLAQPVRLVGRVPAAGPPAGLGGPRRRRRPGLREQRERVRHVHDPRGPRAWLGRSADAAG